MNLLDYIRRHRDWSLKTFGPHYDPGRLIAHIKNELEEIEKAPHDIMEWIDVIILAIDGAWRCDGGRTVIAVADALFRKQIINMGRKWPEWRTVKSGEPIEHVRHSDDMNDKVLRGLAEEEATQKRYLVDPPGGWHKGTKLEFDDYYEALSYLNTCPERTRLVDRGLGCALHELANKVPLASNIHPALGEIDECGE